MLVNKRQEWDLYQEESTEKSTVQAPRLNVTLRARCLTLAVVIAVMAMFATVQSEAIISAGYDLVKTKAQIAKIEKENELLRLDIAKLKSPERIKTIATKDLGMVVPQTVYCAENAGKPSGDNAAKEEKSVAGKSVDTMKVSKAEANKTR
jgi:cell division protein FtsL